jgi:hypothetical protein
MFMKIKNNKQRNRLGASITAPFSLPSRLWLLPPRAPSFFLAQAKHDIYRLIC